MVVEFRIGGRLRFLSHQETARLFQRALVRSGVRLSYSKGFNPRPRISLPLPRSVGLEGDAELLCVLIETDTPAESQTPENIDAEQIRRKLERQLPLDCPVVSLDLIQGRAKFHPVAAAYEFEVERAELLEKVGLKAESRCIGKKHLFIERRIDEKGNTRTVDVGGFIELIEFDGLKIVVTCKISFAGTIRVDEILKLLGLDCGMLSSPIRRRNIQWQKA